MKKTQAKILVVDDQEDILFTVKMLLKKRFQDILTVSNPKKINEILITNEIDVVLLDMNYRIGFEDGKEGVYYLKEILKTSVKTKVILMTAFGEVQTAVESLKSGAFDYILKPWDNHKLIESINKAVLESRKLRNERTVYTEQDSFFRGNSLQVKKTYTLADKVAKTQANVLILGENGTGKYVMAKYIHDNSKLSEQAFVHVDLGALSEQIFESELFGYAKGAFTDAKVTTKGRFETAENGTIFLDEIGNLPLHLQSKLLQVLQSKTITRLGESKPRPINARIITATNADLKKEVAKGNFREDLYYRINTMEIELPALRYCKEDKLPLAIFLLQKLSEKYEKNEVVFDESAKQRIQEYAWHGNIRELQNKIERAIIVSENKQISVTDLGIFIEEQPQEEAQSLSLETIEKQRIQEVLLKTNFNISKASKELGLSRASLYRRIEKYNIKTM